MVVNLVADKVVGCRALIFLFRLFAVLRCFTAAAAAVDCGIRASNMRDIHHDRLHIGAAALDLILKTIFISNTYNQHTTTTRNKKRIPFTFFIVISDC